MKTMRSLCRLGLGLALAAGGAASAWAQRPGNEVGTGQSLPLSDNASNTTPDNTRSAIAPRLPAPPVPESAPPAAFLRAAREALAEGRTGEAQEALERAETRALDRSVRYSAGNQPSRSPLIQTIMQARGAVAQGDRARALQLIDSALRQPDAAMPDQ
jgi:hypothetical protein